MTSTVLYSRAQVSISSISACARPKPWYAANTATPTSTSRGLPGIAAAEIKPNKSSSSLATTKIILFVVACRKLILSASVTPSIVSKSCATIKVVDSVCNWCSNASNLSASRPSAGRIINSMLFLQSS